MIKARRQTFRTIRVTGIRRGAGIDKRLLDALTREIIQDDIAAKFLKERTGFGQLKAPRSRAYRRWKAKQKLPFGNKKGHLTGKTQRTLDRRKLWRLNVQRPKGKMGSATIILDNEKFIRLVPYMEFYQKGYTQRGAGILVVTKKMADNLQRALNEAAKPINRKAAAKAAAKKIVKRNKQTKGRRKRRAS